MIPLDALRSALAVTRAPDAIDSACTIHPSQDTGWLLASAISIASGATAPTPARTTDEIRTLPPLVLAPGQGAAAEEEADFEVTGVLAEGGMGRLLLARQRSLGREVVIKEVKPGLTSPEMILALLTEARICGALEHPGIVPVHALGRGEDGRPLMVMKRIEGVVWRALIDDPSHPAWGRLVGHEGDRLLLHLRALSGVCNALEFAHSRGVLHRDIKVDNVMVGFFGEVYLLDWGIALGPDEPRGPGPLVGTPAYIAPEMVSGDTREVDERTDVYLLGASLHHALTGRHRHSAARLDELLVAALTSAPHGYGEGVPAELASLCNLATSRAKERRPASARAFREALDEFLRHRSSNALVDLAERSLRGLAPRIEAARGEQRWELHRGLLQGRFALEQALREWPDNPRAAEALRGCASLQLSLALALENAAEARMFAGELGPLDPSQEARLEALERKLEDQSSAVARLEHLLFEQDPKVREDSRHLIFSFIGFLIVAASVALDRLPSEPAAMIYGALLVASLLVALVMRRRLVDRINRKLIECFLAYLALVLLHQLALARRGVQGRGALESDVEAALSAAVAVAITLHPIFWSVAAVMALCWGYIQLNPGSEIEAIRATGVGMSTLLLVVGVRGRLRR